MKRLLKSINCSKPSNSSITCSKIEIPHNLIFTTILITIISLDYSNLSLANEYVGVTIPSQVIKYNHCCSRWINQLDYSFHIKLNYLLLPKKRNHIWINRISFLFRLFKAEGFGKPFGPQSQVGDKLGCGIKFPRDEDGETPQQVKVFFTHNRKEVLYHGQL